MNRPALVAASPIRGVTRSSKHVKNAQVRARRLAPDRRGVGLIRVEWRVEVDKVYGVAIETPHDIEIIARPDRAVGEVRSRHLASVDSRTP